MQSQQMLVMYPFKMLLLLCVLNQTHCDNMLDMFRESCPYNKFCTVDSLQNVKPNTTSCCMDCFCDKMCHAFGDCCPDVGTFNSDVIGDVIENGTITNLIKARCASIIAPTVYADGLWLNDSMHYRMIDTCPSDYKDTGGVVDRCEETLYDPDRSLDDIAIVSSPNSVVFKNNFCALCHGVTDAVRWQLEVLDCRKQLESVRLRASKIKPYISQNCILASIRPDNLLLDSRLLPCQRITSDCIIGAGGSLEESFGCKNGPIMPYFHGDYIYKNALCYRCDGRGADPLPSCPGKLGVRSRTKMASSIKLLDIDYDSFSSVRPTSNTPCSESKILDPYTNKCRNLYCPPFEAASFGKCQQIASPVHMDVIVRIVFWTTDDIIISRPVNRYDESVSNFYRRHLRSTFEDLECSWISVYVKVYSHTVTNKLLYLVAGIEIELNDKNCTLRRIGNLNETTFAGTWLINDKPVAMLGRTSFSKFTGNVNWDLLMYDDTTSRNTRLIDQFFVCPYVEVKLAWYNKLLAAVEGGQDNVTILKSLSMETNTLTGAYVLSETLLAVCADQYLNVSSISNREILHVSSIANRAIVINNLMVLFQCVHWFFTGAYAMNLLG